MKILMFIVLMMLLSGNSFSCSEKTREDEDSEIVAEPEKAILGKWELILKTRFGGRDAYPYIPTGYVEYLPDSLMAWYDYATKKYTVFEGKYWLEITNNLPNSCRLLHYQNTLIITEDGERYYQYTYYPDMPPFFNNFMLSVISNDSISLYQLDVDSYIGDFYYIYKRKK